MATITDRTNPSFVRWPINNNRSGLREVNLPVVLTVPFTRDPVTQAPIADSQVSDLKFFIEDAPSSARVAGFQNAGIFIPDLQRFVRSISESELANVKIRIEDQIFFDQTTGEAKNFEDVVDGDFFEYTLLRGIVEHTGPRDRIEFISHADYFDLSPFTIATAELKPYGTYGFSWQCTYFNRILSPTGLFLCLNTESGRLARITIPFKHPGEIHQMMIEQTPTVYFDGQPLENDNLVKFYRPFADALQDIFDEQELLVGINWIEKIPAQLIPYLAYLIGWDIPNFPGATDRIRRAVLRNGRRLQQLKGSRRVIRELFELLGFTIDIVNLWYRRDGKTFVGPDESQPGFPEQEIETQTVCQTEVLFADYDTDGFGNVEIPFLFRPTSDSDVVIDAFLVETGSEAEDQLQDLMDMLNTDPESLSGSVCSLDANGFPISQPLNDSVTAPTVGRSKILLSQRLGPRDEILTGEAPISKFGLKYDFDKISLTATFDHFLKFEGRLKLYAFATYNRQKIIVPPSLTDLRSNRFDIRILFDRITGEAPSSQLLDFLLDFIFRLKAFHSILRKIIFTLQLGEVYNVIDFCCSLTSPSDCSELQTIPAIIPIDREGCSEEIFNRGFKQSDLDLQDEILNGLKAEHAVWKALDGTHQIPPDLEPIIASLTRLPTNPPSGTECQFTQHGQDKVAAKVPTEGELVSRKDFDHVPDDRAKVCDENPTIDHCFKGRVRQEIATEPTLLLKETVHCKPCNLMVGQGFYYELPNISPTRGGSLYNRTKYGMAKYGAQGLDTTDVNNFGTSRLADALIRMNAYPNRVHFTVGHGLTFNDVFTNDRVAIRRPSLDIDRDNLFIPGHRFILMNRLENNFTHSTYTFRPWDSQFDPLTCPEDMQGPTLADLDPRLETNSDGDLVLVFNQIPYNLFGNGLIPDVSSMCTHEDRIFFVTHSLFSTSDERPWIDHEGALTLTDLTTVCFSEEYGPIYESANPACGCDNPSESFSDGSSLTSGADFIDGYPAEFGRFSFDIGDFDYPRGESSDVDLALLLGLPAGDFCTGAENSLGTTPSELLFKLGSGIKLLETDPEFNFVKPIRNDCNCLFFDCGSTGGSNGSQAFVDRCHIDLFRDPNGAIDPNCDRVETISKMILPEEVGTCSNRMELYPLTAPPSYAAITNLLCFDATLIQLALDGKFPPSGTFFFVDQYGIIHDGSFTVSGNQMDITVTTKDPRVPGEPPQGFVSNKNVFRRGVITTCRQVLELVSAGVVNILSSTCTQAVTTFQSTFNCSDRLPNDPFAFHLNCGVLDDIEFDVTIGPGFEEP